MALRSHPREPSLRPTPGPSDVRFLQIEPTTRCNFKCAFCAGRAMEQGDLDLDTFRLVVESLPHLEHMQLQGEGEPLLCAHFFEMARIAREAGVRVSLITNGGLLQPMVVGRILDAGIQHVMVSLESAEPEEFEAIRGGNFATVVGGLERLMAARKERGLERPAVGFAVTVLRSTRTRTAGILALYKRLGLDGGILLQPLQGMESYTRHYDAAMDGERLTGPESETHLIRAYTDPAMRRIGRSRSTAKGFYEEMMGAWRPGSRRCPWLDSSLSVNFGGTATPCCHMKAPDRYGLGRFGADEPADILARREPLRAELAAGRIPAACEGCVVGYFAVLTRARLIGTGLKWFWKWSTQGRLPQPPDGPPPPLQ